MAPVVRTARDGERELVIARWGFPSPPNLGTVPVTNVRNLKSPYWRGWLKAEWRCLVPTTSFCEMD
jgi:putative SOS response-associated peptidase YedK